MEAEIDIKARPAASCGVDAAVVTQRAETSGPLRTEDQLSNEDLIRLRNYYWTTCEAEKHTGILAHTYRDWINSAALPANHTRKGSREILLLDPFLVLMFLTTERAGMHRLPVQEVLISSVARPISLQYRSTRDESDVDDLIAAVESGAKLPPIALFSIDGVQQVADGRRRLRALEICGYHVVSARIFPGGPATARQFAFLANQTHGRRPRQVRTAIVRFIREDPRLLDLVLKNGISHRAFARQFLFERSACARAFTEVKGDLRVPSQGRGMPADVCTRVARDLRRARSCRDPRLKTAHLVGAYSELADLLTDHFRVPHAELRDHVAHLFSPPNA